MRRLQRATCDQRAETPSDTKTDDNSSTFDICVHLTVGPLLLDQLHANDITALMRQVQTTAVHRCNHRDGRNAADHLLLAQRRVYRCVVADGLIGREADPAR